MNAQTSGMIKMSFSHLHGSGRALRPSPGGLPKTDTSTNAENQVFAAGLFPYRVCKDWQSEELDLVQCRRGKDISFPGNTTRNFYNFFVENISNEMQGTTFNSQQKKMASINRYGVK